MDAVSRIIGDPDANPPNQIDSISASELLRLLLLVCMLAQPWPVFAQGKPSEYDVKAVYLYNFGKFIKFPARDKSRQFYSVCIVGHDPFGPILEATVSGEKIDNRPVVVKHITGTRDADACQILFVSSTEQSKLKQILADANASGTLTVSDMPGFVDKGGMIQFVTEGDRIRFAINLAAARQAGLELSSELLKVATTVKNTPGT